MLEFPTLIPTGIRDLDRLLNGGLAPGEVTIVGGRPSMGKSALALAIAGNVAHALPVVFFSLEQSREEIVLRLLSAGAKVESGRLRQGRVVSTDLGRVAAAATDLEAARLEIVADAALSAQQIVDIVEELQRERGPLGLVVIDFVQLLVRGSESDDRYAELAALARMLKIVAHRIAVPIVVVSQLNRELERRHDKRPVLHDLRDSGALEDAADLVLLLYRDEYYDELIDRLGLAEIIVAKNRRGAPETATVAFLRRYARFADLALPPAAREELESAQRQVRAEGSFGVVGGPR